MRIAIVYNHDTKDVIKFFRIPNHEIIGQKTIKRITDAFRAKKHQVKARGAYIIIADPDTLTFQYLVNQ